MAQVDCSAQPNIYDCARVSSWGHVPAVCSIQGFHATLSFLNTGNMSRKGKFKYGRIELINIYQFFCVFAASLLNCSSSVSVTTHLHLLSWGVSLLWAERRDILTTNDDLLQSSGAGWARVYFSLSVCKCHMAMIPCFLTGSSRASSWMINPANVIFRRPINNFISIQNSSHVRWTEMMFNELVKGWDQYFSTQDMTVVQGICVINSNTSGF